MNISDLLTTYVTILIGALTSATIVITLLKEELLGKSFGEVINYLNNSNNDFRKTKCLFIVSLLLFGIRIISWPFQLPEITDRIYIYIVIFMLVLAIYRFFHNIFQIYKNIIDINMMSVVYSTNKKKSKIKKWQKMLLDFIKDSTEESHYNIIEKLVDSDFFDDKLNELNQNTKIEENDIKSLDDYVCKKRWIFIEKVITFQKSENLKVKDNSDFLSELDFEILGYRNEVNCFENLEQFSKYSKDKLVDAYILGFTKYLRNSLKKENPINKILEKLREFNKNLQQSDRLKTFLMNTLCYPEIINNAEIRKGINQLILDNQLNFSNEENDMINYFLIGYQECTEILELVNKREVGLDNIYEDDMLENLKHVNQLFNSYCQGHDTGAEYLKRKKEKILHSEKKSSELELYFEYLSKIEKTEEITTELLTGFERILKESFSNEFETKIEGKNKIKDLFYKSGNEDDFPYLKRVFSSKYIMKPIFEEIVENGTEKSNKTEGKMKNNSNNIYVRLTRPTRRISKGMYFLFREDGEKLTDADKIETTKYNRVYISNNKIELMLSNNNNNSKEVKVGRVRWKEIFESKEKFEEMQVDDSLLTNLYKLMDYAEYCFSPDKKDNLTFCEWKLKN